MPADWPRRVLGAPAHISGSQRLAGHSRPHGHSEKTVSVGGGPKRRRIHHWLDTTCSQYPTADGQCRRLLELRSICLGRCLSSPARRWSRCGCGTFAGMLGGMDATADLVQQSADPVCWPERLAQLDDAHAAPLQVSQLAADTAPAPNAWTWKAVTQAGHEAPRWCAPTAMQS